MLVNFTPECLLVCRMAKKMDASKICAFCDLNKAKCSIPLFRQTQNKEIVEKVVTCATGGVVLAVLAKAIGLDFSVRFGSKSELNSALLCKKCSRKIVNCYLLHIELAGKCVNVISKGTPSKQNSNYGKRQFESSPSGLTPRKKTPKQSSSKRSLFSCKIRKELDDEIANLMNLPVEVYERKATVVKVGFLF